MTDKSAFPHTGYEVWDQSAERFFRADGEPGMTYKEWQWTLFAAATVQAFISQSPSAATARCVPGAAIQIADAMMAAIAEHEQERDDV